MGAGVAVKVPSYDVVDLWFEMGEKLPPELTMLALSSMIHEPHRLDGRCAEAVARLVETWKQRMPLTDELNLVVALLGPRTAVVEKELSPETDPETIPLIDLVTKFTKGTRPTSEFQAKFKLVNRILMPAVIRCIGFTRKPA
jgi:hypothetical protein